MGRYVENSLGRNENLVRKAKLTKLFLVGTWIKAILLCWLLFIPVFKAIAKTVVYCNTELGITTKRIIGKSGVINTRALDAPLDKIQTVSTAQGFWGKIFGYGDLRISTAEGTYYYTGVVSPDSFKGTVMAQIDQYEEDKIKQQAREMANAMAGIMGR
ncbi:MAG: PH domain-containing protein [Clostridia bacterium]|nr:PH domain-containing protein [Clostridia bacterium]